MRFLLPIVIVLPMMAATQNNDDATILAYRGLRSPCDGTVVPVLRIENVGINNMASCVVETWKNGIAANSFNWILAVPALMNEVRQPSLPAVNAAEGDTLEFHIISVNAVPDQGATGNDLQMVVREDPMLCTTSTLEIETLTDGSPAEISWVLRGANGQPVATGDSFTDPFTTYISWIDVMPDACVGLEIADAGGDGFAGGHVTVRSATIDVAQLDGADLTDEGYLPLRAGLVTSIGDRAASSPRLYPNPADGSVRIDLPPGLQVEQLLLLDAQGRTQLERTFMSADERTLDLSTIATGTYVLRIGDGNGWRTFPLIVAH